MNTENQTLELVETVKPVLRNEIALPDSSPAGMMMTALRNGASLEQVEKMMLLQERWEATQARKNYNVSFADFKAEAVRIVKATKVTAGPLAGKSYAELYSVVDALTPALSRHGLSASWKLTKDDKDWMEVTCYLRHIDGHEESVSMGGPPDSGGAKNAIQARASTKSYLERYTLKAICGVAEGGEDDDGAGDAVETEKPKTLPAYSNGAFTTNLPKWRTLIESGKKTADAVIKNVSLVAVMSDEQIAKVRATVVKSKGVQA